MSARDTTELKPKDKVLIFDFDGVLADTLDDILRYAEIVCSQLGHPCKPTREDLEALDPMSFDQLGRQLKLPEEKVDEFAQRSFVLFMSRRQPPDIIEGISHVVAQLSATSKIGIVTGNTLDVVRAFLEHHGLVEHVDVVLDVNDSGSRAEKILKAADSLGQPGSEIYMIGDAVSDIRAARQASVKSVAVTWGHQSREKLEAALPDYLVHSPEDLMQL